MAISFKFYSDAALTSEFVGDLKTSHQAGGTTGRVDKVLYYGSTEASRTLEAASNPGIDDILFSVSDSAIGSGHEATAVKMALSQSGLNSATAGADLSIGTELLSGSANAKAVWFGFEASYLTVGVSTELSIATNALSET